MGTPTVICEPGSAATGIRRQVEYYFSDSNLPRDRFLRAKIDENDGGWVDIATLLTFNKLKELGATTEAVCEAIEPSEFLEVDASGERIRRTAPMPEAAEWRARTIYAKGWIANDPEPPVSEVEAIFAPYGKIRSVRMRRWSADDGARHFKGSIFIEFENAEAAERAMSDTHTIKVKASEEEGGDLVDKELIVMGVEAHSELKRQEVRERHKRLKERRAGLKGSQGIGDEKKSGKKADQNGAAAVKRDFVKGLIMGFRGVGETASREDLKETIETYGNIAWIDFERGSSDGHIRFTGEGTAAKAAATLTAGSVEICGKVPDFMALEGDEEAAYWKKVWEEQDRVKNSRKRARAGDSHGRHGNNKKFRGGGRGGGRGRGSRDQ